MCVCVFDIQVSTIATSIVTYRIDGVKKTTIILMPLPPSSPSTPTPANSTKQKFAIFIFIMDEDGNVSLESRSVVVSGFMHIHSLCRTLCIPWGGWRMVVVVFFWGGDDELGWVERLLLYITTHGYILKYLFTVKIHLFVTTRLHKSQFLLSKSSLFFSFSFSLLLSSFCFFHFV